MEKTDTSSAALRLKEVFESSSKLEKMKFQIQEMESQGAKRMSCWKDKILKDIYHYDYLAMKQLCEARATSISKVYQPESACRFVSVRLDDLIEAAKKIDKGKKIDRKESLRKYSSFSDFHFLLMDNDHCHVKGVDQINALLPYKLDIPFKEPQKLWVFIQHKTINRLFKPFQQHSQTAFDNASYPFDIAVHPLTNEIYVTDYNMHQILVLSPSLDLISKVGSKGKKKGEFLNPTSLAFSKLGFLAVVDCGNHRIQLFDADQNVESSFGSFGIGPGQFIHPTGIAFDQDDYLYITDPHGCSIQKFTSKGVFLQFIGTQESSHPLQGTPYSIVNAYANELFIWCFGKSYFQIYDSTGEYCRNTEILCDLSPGSILSLSSGPDHTLFLADGLDTIWHLKKTGQVIDFISLSGGTKGLFVRDKTFYSLSWHLKSVFAGVWSWDSQLQSRHSWRICENEYISHSQSCEKSKLKQPTSVIVHPIFGDVYVSNTGAHQIDVFTPDFCYLKTIGSKGQELGCFLHPTCLFPSVDGEFIGVCDYGNHRVQIHNLRTNTWIEIGCKGCQNGQFDRPCSGAFDSTGSFFIVDLGNKRIQQFASDGSFVSCFSCKSHNHDSSYALGESADRSSPEPEIEFHPCGICITKENEIAVIGQGGSFIQVYTNGGILVREVGIQQTSKEALSSIFVGPDDTFGICDPHSRLINFYDRKYGFTKGSIKQRGAAGACFGIDDRLYVSRMFENNIVVY